MTALFMNLSAFGTLLSGVLTITAKNPVISVIYLIFTFVFAAGYIILIGIQFIGISYIVIYVGAIAVLFLFVIMMINIKLTDILETGTQYTKNLPLAISIGSLFLYLIYNIIPFNFYNVPSLLLSGQKLSLAFDKAELNTTPFGETGAAAVNIFNNNLFIALPKIGEANSSHSNYFSSSLGVENISVSNIVGENTDFNILNFLQIEVLGHNLYTYASILLIILSFILLLAMFATIVISKKK
jgi:NADH-ubiquinone oxidoreductase chain 6